MKMIYAIVGRDDSHAVESALTQSGFTVTKLASSGGFLKSGNTTFLIVVEDNSVDNAIDIISRYCKRRSQTVPSAEFYGGGPTIPIEVSVGGATLFVTDVERFEKI